VFITWLKNLLMQNKTENLFKENTTKKTGLMLIFLFFLVHGMAQNDLKSLLSIAEINYPAIAARQADADAALVRVSLEKNTILPSLDAAYQANYSTYNNITGMSYPGQLLPISGPPVPENYNSAVPGSAASLLLKWAPLTFGQRSAAVEYSQKMYEKQLAGLEDEVLRLKFRVAFAYLDISSTGELIKALQKNIERSEFNLKQSKTLVISGLRPAVDTLRFIGELSKAKTELLQFENLIQNQIQELFELLATPEVRAIEPGSIFVSQLPSIPTDSQSINRNPLLKIAELDLGANQVRLHQVSRSWTPKLEFWGTTYARGSGISFDGIVNKSDGWNLSRYNYGVGFQVAFPILELSNVKLKTTQQKALLHSSENYLKQTKLELTKQEMVAMNDLITSLEIAAEIPNEYAAGLAAFNTLQIRYSNGLIDYTELVQSQYDLFKAEASLKNAYVSGWKSLLKLAVIRGDINLFINQIPNQ
jgi:outer membrane protein